jgi:CBS domain-containing protein
MYRGIPDLGGASPQRAASNTIKAFGKRRGQRRTPDEVSHWSPTRVVRARPHLPPRRRRQSEAAFYIGVLRVDRRCGPGERGRDPKPNPTEEVTMFVRDAMTPDAEWISPDLSLVEVGRRMRDKRIGCLPVGDKDRLIGMITDRDLACRAIADGADPKTTKAREVMTKGITWCFDDQSLDEAARLMEEKQIHHLPVLNRRKRMVGILSLSDLALKGDKTTFKDVSKLASRDAARHGSGSLAH